MFTLRSLVVCAGALTGSFAVGAEPAPAPRPKSDFADATRAPDPRDFLARSKANADLWKRANEHFTKGRYKEALDCYGRWVPSGTCGTCNAHMRTEQLYRSAMCHVHLNDLPAAVRVCLDGCRTPDCSESSVVGVFLFETYRAAGQLNDLRKIIEEIEKAALEEHVQETGRPLDPGLRHWIPRLLRTWPARELCRVAQLGEKKDVAALVAICATEAPDWQVATVTEALAGYGEKAVAEIRKALADRNKDTNTNGLIYLLGRLPDPAALELLVELTRTEKDRNADSVVHALSLKGEAGRKILRQIASDDTNGVKAAAARWMREPPAAPLPPAPVAALPQPKLGSLPKTLAK